MARSVTNGELATMFQAFSKLMDERHDSNHRLLTDIRSEVRLTNGRVTTLERDVAVFKAKSEADLSPRHNRTVLKVGGGTTLGVLITKALEWIQK